MAFPTTLDSDFGTLVDNEDDAEASNVNELRRAVEGLEAKMGINSSAVTASIDYKVNNFFVSGRSIYLYENTAPTGWRIVAITDKVLAVKGGDGAYNINGGNTGGSFTISIANMPAHTHTLGAPLYYPGRYPQQATAAYGGGNTGSTGGSDGLYRPAAAVGIIVSKDA